MFQRSHGPKTYISNVLYSEDSIDRKSLFRSIHILKVLQGYLCSESPVVRWMNRLCNVRRPYGPTVTLIWFYSNAKFFFCQVSMGSDFYMTPAMCNNSFCRVKFAKCLKHNISIQMSIQSINDVWCIYLTRGRVMMCQKGQAPIL